MLDIPRSTQSFRPVLNLDDVELEGSPSSGQSGDTLVCAVGDIWHRESHEADRTVRMPASVVAEVAESMPSRHPAQPVATQTPSVPFWVLMIAAVLSALAAVGASELLATMRTTPQPARASECVVPRGPVFVEATQAHAPVVRR